jgi:hypothetical protein
MSRQNSLYTIKLTCIEILQRHFACINQKKCYYIKGSVVLSYIKIEKTGFFAWM